MATMKVNRDGGGKWRSGMRTLGIPKGRRGGALEIGRQVRAGFAFGRLERFQKVTSLPWEKVAQWVGIPLRTLARRQHEGKLQADESDRLWRASSLFDQAVDLFEGDVDGARKWLLAAQPGLGGEVPLEVASTDVGSREVENLIGQLEYGVFP